VRRLAVIGGGAWGTALTIVLAPRFEQVRLWVYETDVAERLQAQRQNETYLPGFQIAENIFVTSELGGLWKAPR
jgi:glycerol-3-phosphate dehydrogenase (NAD(P)+)